MLLEEELKKQFSLMGLTELAKTGWIYEKLSDAELLSLLKDYEDLKHLRSANLTLNRYIEKKRPHLREIMYELLGSQQALKRDYISWQENYGKTFKIFYTPEELIISRKGPMASIITPDSPTAWNNWEELQEHDLKAWRERWDELQKYLPNEKYREIRRAMKKYLS
jgi:hypothetical protein